MHVYTSNDIFRSCFLQGTQQATLCPCIQMVFQGHRQIKFPSLTLLTGSVTVVASPVRMHCPTALGTPQMLHTLPQVKHLTHLHWQLTVAGWTLPHEMWLTDPFKWQICVDKNSAANAACQDGAIFSCYSCLQNEDLPVISIHDLKTISCLGRTLSYTSWLLIPGLHVTALYVALGFPSCFRSLTSFP